MRERQLFFRNYELLRYKEQFKFDPDKKVSQRSITDKQLQDIETNVEKNIVAIRNFVEGPDESGLKAQERQRKFCTFILKLNEKHALRTWKEKTWGLGGDPRLALMMI